MLGTLARAGAGFATGVIGEAGVVGACSKFGLFPDRSVTRAALSSPLLRSRLKAEMTPEAKVLGGFETFASAILARDDKDFPAAIRSSCGNKRVSSCACTAALHFKGPQISPKHAAAGRLPFESGLRGSATAGAKRSKSITRDLIMYVTAPAATGCLA
jgi:hypothetical protein